MLAGCSTEARQRREQAIKLAELMYCKSDPSSIVHQHRMKLIQSIEIFASNIAFSFVLEPKVPSVKMIVKNTTAK